MIRTYRGAFAALALLVSAGCNTPVLAQSTTTINGLPAGTTPTTGAEFIPMWQAGATKKMDLAHVLPNSGVTAGTYGDSTHCPNLTIAANGTVTSATNSTTCPGTGGGGTPGGSNHAVQINSASSFGGILGTTGTVLHGNTGADPSFSAVSLTADVSGILPAANGGNGNGFFAVSGPATSTKTFTFPNASATVLTSNAPVTIAQGGTGLSSAGAATITALCSATGTASSTTFLRGDCAWATPSGSGNVTGPGSAVSGNIASYNGTTGTIIQDGGVAVSSLATLTGAQTLTNKTLTAPTLTAPVLGTPASGNASNMTNIPVAQATGVLPAANGGAGTISGILKANGSGTVSQAVSGTDYLGTSLKVGNSGAAITATTYTIACATDSNTELLFTGSSASAWTLAAPTGSCAYGTAFSIVNRGTASITLTATGNINGASTKVFAAGTSAFVFADPTGTTWYSEDGAGGSGSSTVANGTSALGTSAIASGACGTVVTTSATGVATTDVITAGFNGDPTAVTGYAPATTGMLTIIAYPSANNVNFKVCNNTSASITPGAITLNWRVGR